VSRPDRPRRFELDRPAERIPTGHPQQHPSASRRTHVSRDGGRVQRATARPLGVSFRFRPGGKGQSRPRCFRIPDLRCRVLSNRCRASVRTQVSRRPRGDALPIYRVVVYRIARRMPRDLTLGLNLTRLLPKIVKQRHLSQSRGIELCKIQSV
jgi:hypothetical protein